MRKLNILLRALLVDAMVSTIGHSKPVKDSADAFGYLEQFGYLDATKNANTAAALDPNAFKKAIKDFQEFAGLTVTGQLDSNTLEMMNKPRCGFKDTTGTAEFNLRGGKWRKKRLTYRVTKYPEALSRSQVDSEIRKAFDQWEAATSLTFVASTRSTVDIEIRWETGNHGDGHPFDGPGTTLAHAFFPRYGGDAHFDETERWTVNSRRGINLLQVAAHEFGHSLGLGHSREKKALMAPFYPGYDPNFKLHADDVAGIQALYGSSSGGGGGNFPECRSLPWKRLSNGRWYLIAGSKLSHSQARQYCQKVGANLAEISSDAEDSVISSELVFDLDESTWLSETSSQFGFNDGFDDDFFNDDFFGGGGSSSNTADLNGRCYYLDQFGYLKSDRNCSNKKSFICEADGYPCS